MVKNMAHDAVGSIYANIAAAKSRPSIDVRSITKFETGDAMINFRTDGRKLPFAAYAEVLSSMSGKKALLVEGSIYPTNAAGTEFKAALRGNKRSIPYNEESVKAAKLSVVTANVFKDEDDNVWKVHGEGDGAFIVQEASEDFATILQTQRNRNGVVAANDDSSYAPGDFVSFFDKESRSMSDGFVVDSKDGEVEVFTNNQVTKQVPVVAIVAAIEPSNEMQTAINDIKAAGRSFGMAYITYLKNLYSGSNEWIKAYEQAIRKFAVA